MNCFSVQRSALEHFLLLFMLIWGPLFCQYVLLLLRLPDGGRVLSIISRCIISQIGLILEYDRMLDSSVATAGDSGFRQLLLNLQLDWRVRILSLCLENGVILELVAAALISVEHLFLIWRLSFVLIFEFPELWGFPRRALAFAARIHLRLLIFELSLIEQIGFLRRLSRVQVHDPVHPVQPIHVFRDGMILCFDLDLRQRPSISYGPAQIQSRRGIQIFFEWKSEQILCLLAHVDWLAKVRFNHFKLVRRATAIKLGKVQPVPPSSIWLPSFLQMLPACSLITTSSSATTHCIFLISFVDNGRLSLSHLRVAAGRIMRETAYVALDRFELIAVHSWRLLGSLLCRLVLIRSPSMDLKSFRRWHVSRRGVFREPVSWLDLPFWVLDALDFKTLFQGHFFFVFEDCVSPFLFYLIAFLLVVAVLFFAILDLHVYNDCELGAFLVGWFDLDVAAHWLYDPLADIEAKACSLLIHLLLVP